MKKDDSQFGCDGTYPMVEIQVDEAGPHAPTNLAKATIFWAAGDESVGWGRDEDLQTARSKALGEAVERRAFRERVPMKHCRQDQLPNSIGPATIVRYSAEQYATLGFPYKPFDPNGRSGGFEAILFRAVAQSGSWRTAFSRPLSLTMITEEVSIRPRHPRDVQADLRMQMPYSGARWNSSSVMHSCATGLISPVATLSVWRRCPVLYSSGSHNSRDMDLKSLSAASAAESTRPGLLRRSTKTFVSPYAVREPVSIRSRD